MLKQVNVDNSELNLSAPWLVTVLHAIDEKSEFAGDVRIG
jgi:hypothetical protein